MTKINSTVVVIDDELVICNSLKTMISARCGCNVLCFQDGRDSYPTLEHGEVALVLLDWMMPYPGSSVLREITESFPATRVVVMTALNDVDTAVVAMKGGAKDFLIKPFDPDRLRAVVQTALENYELRRDYQKLKDGMLAPQSDYAWGGIVYKSKPICALMTIIGGLSGSRHPVLITGETGVGKEAFARAVHESSGVTGPFIGVNVAGLDDSTFSDTLFGHKKGAYTGALADREGLVKTAEKGTLFLDEIGDISPESQLKLLRFLQEGEYYRIGSDAIRKSDVRIVAATNADLGKNGKFRQDLFYRLKTHSLPIPPLRDRMEDVPILIKHFVTNAAERLSIKCPVVTSEILYALQGYDYPGNVRELENIINNMVALNRTGELTAKDAPPEISRTHIMTGLGDMSIGQIDSHPLAIMFGKFPTIDEVENYMLDEVLRMTDDNQSAAARVLGLARPTLAKRIKARAK